MLRSFSQSIGEVRLRLLEHKKLVAQISLSGFFIAMAVYYIGHQKAEVEQLGSVFQKSHLQWVVPGIILTLIYILLQGFMYVGSFASIGKKISIQSGSLLFLKRNLVSVFLPAGGITSLAFFNAGIQKKGVQKQDIRAASAIYAVIGIVSVVIIAIPIICLTVGQNYFGHNEWLAIGIIGFSLLAIFYLFRRLSKKGQLYELLIKKLPRLKNFLDTLSVEKIDRKFILWTILASVLIEVVGILQVYVAMLAMDAHPSLLLSIISYFITVILLIVSPFLRGMGAIEVSMIYVLQRFGYTGVEAISITLFYRLLEFWLPLLAGVLSFLLKLNRLIIRTLPAVFIFIMGIVNIMSVLTPPLNDRFLLVHRFFSIRTIWASNYFVLLAGLCAIMTAVFMWQGVRSAFYIAIGLCTVSIIGNLLKSFDYEEAGVALFALVFLLASQKEYRVKRHRGLSIRASQMLLYTVLFMIIYGFAGMLFLNNYYLHLNMDFTDIVKGVFNNLLLLRNKSGFEYNRYVRLFYYSLNILGFLFFCFFAYLLIRPKYDTVADHQDERNTARDMLYRMGKSANDYFKIYFDKSIFYPEGVEGFMAYKRFKTYVVVLEGPVVTNERETGAVIAQFEKYCQDNGLKCFYYRVPEPDLPYFMNKMRKKVLIGQEANLYLPDFSLNGKSKKALRNATNHAVSLGLKIAVYKAPIKDGLLQQLEAVSDEWLEFNDRKEIVFSQGIFQWDALKRETIFTVENDEGMVLAFLNWIPDFGRKIVTYDLLRYLKSAPNGTVDFLLNGFFNYLKEAGYEYVNLGFAPFSGIEAEDSKNFVEQSLVVTRKSIKSISTYQDGLRKSKEKFGPQWTNQYLIYERDFDLIQFPMVFRKITKLSKDSKEFN